jgi:hypothetical protein
MLPNGEKRIGHGEVQRGKVEAPWAPW